MPWVEYTPGEALPDFDTLQVYNCLDCSITAQLQPVLLSEMSNLHLHIYDRSWRVQQLCLAMTAHGLPIDQTEVRSGITHLQDNLEKLRSIWERYIEAVGSPPVNPNSPDQLKKLFYGHLNIPEHTRYDPKRRMRVVSLDRKTLEEVLTLYSIARPLAKVVLAIRANTKLLGVLRAGIEPDGMLRCSFNPAGTETGRLSSNQNVFGGGTNAQNITARLRQIVSVKQRKRLAALDLEQAESRAVAYLSADEAYIEACEGGDLHTTVTKMVWPHLPWTGDPYKDREVAEQVFVRHYSYRDMSKRGGHGSNYYGKPPTIAKHMEIDKAVVEAFQDGYFGRFPGIRHWQLETIATVQRDRVICTPMGRERSFWGRPDDATTHREAIAYVPQSIVGDIMNEGLLQVTRWLRQERISCATVLQCHDAGYFIYDEAEEDWLIPEIASRIIYPIEIKGRELRIPTEVKVGWNWGPAGKNNPEGLVKWKPGFKETRTRRTLRERIMDLRV